MAEGTLIEWATDTFNPWWGCQRVSPGCEKCYAESTDARWHKGNAHWGPTAERKAQSEAYWRQPLNWNAKAEREGRRRRVFCASMADVFEILPADHPSAEMQDKARTRLWYLIRDTPWLDWLLLTKRPENFHDILSEASHWGGAPAPNVWLGVTTEDQQRANERIPILLDTPAAVRFVSYEPALEAVDLAALQLDVCDQCGERIRGSAFCASAWCACAVEGPEPITWASIDWVIAGAESGPGARPCDDNWLRSMRDQCVDAGVAFFLKQKVIGGVKISLPVLDGRSWSEVPGC